MKLIALINKLWLQIYNKLVVKRGYQKILKKINQSRPGSSLHWRGNINQAKLLCQYLTKGTSANLPEEIKNKLLVELTDVINGDFSIYDQIYEIEVIL